MANITFWSKQDGYISEWDADRNYSNDTPLYVGRYLQPGDSFRSLLQFGIDRIPPTSQIEEAELILFLYRNETPSTIHVNAHRLLCKWKQSNVTWNNQPPHKPKPDGIEIIHPKGSGFVKIGISELVEGWYDGSIPNHGLILIGNEQINSVLGFVSSHSKECERSPRLKIRFVDGIIEIYQTEELRVPFGQCPLVDSAPIPLGPRKMATFMIENLSDSWRVEAKLQLGFSDCPDDTFFDAGSWVPIKANGYPGEGIVLSSEDAAEYARVLIKGKGGECLLVHPRTKER